MRTLVECTDWDERTYANPNGQHLVQRLSHSASREPLPVDDVLPQIVEVLRRHGSTVLLAPTGAGKTTRVPQALLESDLAANGIVLMLEPRRLAARAVARRIADELDTQLGALVGYEVRFDRKLSPQTRIRIVTEGIALRMLQEDPFLSNVAAVIFDEFHERSLDADLALAMVRKVQAEARPDLKIVVMSASLAPLPVAEYLGGAPIVESQGRLYPVEITYLREPDPRPIPQRVASRVASLLDETPGDVLVFLPGVGEIRRTSELLETLAEERRLAVLPLYGDMTPEEQDAVLRPLAPDGVSGRPRRKVVLATNVAETSVTIEGITAVLDSGMARVLRYDPSVGLDRLILSRISRASADQRAGRAGRLAPGICWRLWTANEQRRLAEQEEPEVRRVDIAGAALQLLCWGERDVAAFPWFEPPAAVSIQQAMELLRDLGALAVNGLTEQGRQMARLPAHPRVSRLLLEGLRLGCLERVALLAALLSERDPFQRPEQPRTDRPNSDSDLLDRVAALEAFDRSGRKQTEFGQLNNSAARFLFRACDQMVRLTQRAAPRQQTRGANRDVDSDRSSDQSVRRALLAAFPDRVARRRQAGSPRAVMVGGKGVRLSPTSAVRDHELFVCVDLDAGGGPGMAPQPSQGDLFVRLASAIERDWLSAELVSVSLDLDFDAKRERVVAVKRTRYLDLVLDEAPTAAALDERTSALLAMAAAEQLDRALPLDQKGVQGFLTRVRCLREWIPHLELPAFDRDELLAMLPALCAGRRSFEELRQAPLLEFLKGELTHAQRQALDREAPERLSVPSGSQIALVYEVGRPPVLAARIQELFGLRETPRVAAGRVPVLLHLLAPNMRPQQVTEDLRSFWDNIYPKIRKELRQRYPKHSWPEDPWTATAQRRPGKPRNDK